MKAEEHELTQPVMNQYTEFLTALGNWLTMKSATPDNKYKLISKYASLNKNLTDPWGLGVDLLWVLEHKIPETMTNLVDRVADVLDNSDSTQYPPISEFEGYTDPQEAEYLKAIGDYLVSSCHGRKEREAALEKMPYDIKEVMSKIKELDQTVLNRLNEIIRKLKHTNYE